MLKGILENQKHGSEWEEENIRTSPPGSNFSCTSTCLSIQSSLLATPWQRKRENALRHTSEGLIKNHRRRRRQRQVRLNSLISL